MRAAGVLEFRDIRVTQALLERGYVGDAELEPGAQRCATFGTDCPSLALTRTITSRYDVCVGGLGDDSGAVYVAISEISVPPAGGDALEYAFQHRLGAVDSWSGFLGLEVLADRRHRGRYLMISRWVTREAFRAYMKSEEHRRSHARIPDGPDAPRAAGFSDYDQVAR